MRINSADDLTKLIKAAVPDIAKQFVRGLIRSKKDENGFEIREAILIFQDGDGQPPF